MSQSTKTTPLVPIPGMTVQPEYFPGEAWDTILGTAWAKLLLHMMDDQTARKKFTERTNHDFSDLPKTGLQMAIDKSSEHIPTSLLAWCDYITEFYWGKS